MSAGGASSDESGARPVRRSIASLRAFADAHGLGGRAIAAMRATGIANDIWALGDDLVLRVGRDWDEAWSDARTESVAVPAARAVGIRTPALVVCDLSRAILDAPVTVYERVHGDTLGLVLDTRGDWSVAMRGLGRELARLHVGVATVADPNGWLDEPGTEDARAWLDACARAGLLDADTARVSVWLDRLEPAVQSAPTPRFLHNDAHANNVMVDAAGEHLALLDWGDAGFGDPAIELATFSIDGLDAVVAGYAEVAPALIDDGFAGRVLWNQIGHCLRKAATPRPGRSAAVGVDRLRRLLSFARTAGPRWRPWLP